MPSAIVTHLQREIAQGLPELKPRFESVGGDLMQMPPEKVMDFIKSEHDRWTKIIRDAGIRLD